MAGPARFPQREKQGRDGVYLRTLRQYAESTTVHGFSYLLEQGQSPLAGLFWKAAVGLCFALAVGLSVQAYVQWRSNLVTSVVRTASLPVREVEFPTITICSRGRPADGVKTVLFKQVVMSLMTSESPTTKS